MLQATHTSLGTKICVCAGVVVVVAVGEGVEEVRGGRKECVRGISERGRERRVEGERRRNDTKEKCA